MWCGDRFECVKPLCFDLRQATQIDTDPVRYARQVV